MNESRRQQIIDSSNEHYPRRESQFEAPNLMHSKRQAFREGAAWADKHPSGQAIKEAGLLKRKLLAAKKKAKKLYYILKMGI